MARPSDVRQAGKHLTDVDIGKILGLAKAEIPQREIASLMCCSQKAVQHTLATYLFETFQGRNPRRQYSHKTSKLQDYHITRTLQDNPTLPLRDITNLIGLPISERTVRRRRSAAGLGSFIAIQKPGLRAENVAKRLEWAMKYKNWTIED
jgi:hypothetical protein